MEASGNRNGKNFNRVLLVRAAMCLYGTYFETCDRQGDRAGRCRLFFAFYIIKNDIFWLFFKGKLSEGTLC